jgi:hypothetical protein
MRDAAFQELVESPGSLAMIRNYEPYGSSAGGNRRAAADPAIESSIRCV